MPESPADYNGVLKFIYDREHFGMKLGLENISRFLKHIDNPQHRFSSIHIAGTNGKGSTAAYIDSIMRRAGCRVGIFTSPHLVDFRERIRINGKKIEKRFIVDFINDHRKVIERDQITFFEVCTAMAFSYFAQRKVDLAVIETGLGGRLDATNTLTPLLAVITDISYDHMSILGETLQKIAYEKAGIIKKDTPVLVGSMSPEPRQEIARVAKLRNAPMVYQKLSVISQNGGMYGFNYNSGFRRIDNLLSSLPGRHQQINASLAITAVEMLRESGYVASSSDIREGLKKTVWPGRFQIIRGKKRPTVILDVGHNRAGVKVMADCFREMFPGRRADMIIGFVRYKNLEEILKYIYPIANNVVVARLDTDRSTEPVHIAGYFFKRRRHVVISDSLTESARKMVSSAKTDDIIIVGGSHFGVGEFLANRVRIMQGEKKW